MPAFVSFKFVSNSLDTLIIENFGMSQLSVKWQIKEPGFLWFLNLLGQLFSAMRQLFAGQGLFRCFR